MRVGNQLFAGWEASPNSLCRLRLELRAERIARSEAE
jgi:hypothetical protein